MTEDKLKKELFDLQFEYSLHTPKEKEELQEEYLKKLKQIRKELARLKREKIEKEIKIK